MRLINTSTRAFEEFIGRNIPKYVILSHTWEEEEVSYDDYLVGRHLQHQMKGFAKINKTCRLAQEENIHYAWVDTCCIDKKSSAELSEAINSMFRWYERAEVCFALLSDLPNLPQGGLKKALGQCRWFTRGWTLQELIAPGKVKFFNAVWDYIGSKHSMSLSLSRITDIQASVLTKDLSLTGVSVAQKMKWASKRETTRIEDIAYCLLGIFDVNMPLLYGEEEKAFRRLQEEIIKSTPDLSIFAWRLTEQDKQGAGLCCGVLAEAPRFFSELALARVHNVAAQTEFTISNVGVRLQSTLVLCHTFGQQVPHYALPVDRFMGVPIAILLRKVGNNKFLRMDPFRIHFISIVTSLSGTHHLLLRPPPQFVTESESPQTHSNWITEKCFRSTRHRPLSIKLSTNTLQICQVFPRSRFDDADQVFFSDEFDDQSNWGVLKLSGLPGTSLINPDLMLYITSWGRDRAPQFSLVPCGNYTNEIEIVQSKIVTSELARFELLSALNEQRIPRFTRAVVDFSVSKRKTIISVICLMKDRGWFLNITSEINETGYVPVEQQMTTWDLR